MDGLTFLETTLKMPLMKLPVRSVAAQISHGTVLISPGSRLEPSQLKDLSHVTDIVAPSLIHAAGVHKASAAYPEAKTWGVPGLKKIKPRTNWTNELKEQLWPYQDELAAIQVNGMPQIKEVVFVHKKSKSLIVADLCFNMTDQRGLGPWLILNLFGTYRRFGVSRFFLKYIKDKKAFQDSLKKIFSHDFENIIMSHGEIIRGDGKPRLLKALEERGLKPN